MVSEHPAPHEFTPTAEHGAVGGVQVCVSETDTPFTVSVPV